MVTSYDLLQLRELERLVSKPIDPEQEAWRAQRHCYVARGGQVHKLRTVGGSSFLTGTQVELIYANTASGTAKNTFTSEVTVNDEAGMGPAANLPAYFVQAGPDNALGKALRFIVRGIVSTTGTPTFTFTVRSGTKANTTAAIIGGTGAITGQSGISNQLWEMEFDLIVRAMGTTPATSTVQAMGMFSSPGGFTSGTNMNIWAGAAQPGTVATFDITITNYINVNATCGTSSASNGVTVLQLLIQGMN